MEGEKERRAGIFIGPEYATVQRAVLVAAAREAADMGCDIVIACAFNYDAHAGEFDKFGRDLDVPRNSVAVDACLYASDNSKFGPPKVQWHGRYLGFVLARAGAHPDV